MLKKILINQKVVPVPIPIKNLEEALVWIERTLIKPGHTVTRVTLGSKVLGEDTEFGTKPLSTYKLDIKSKLEVQIDSPIELSIQTLDTLRNLSSVIMGGLKALAVDCWQARPVSKPKELEANIEDVQLVLDLLENLNGLVDPKHIECAAVQGIGIMIQKTASSLGIAKSNSDWRACARLLLNRLEPLLKDIVDEAEKLQIRITALNGAEFGSKADVG